MHYVALLWWMLVQTVSPIQHPTADFPRLIDTSQTRTETNVVFVGMPSDEVFDPEVGEVLLADSLIDISIIVSNPFPVLDEECLMTRVPHRPGYYHLVVRRFVPATGECLLYKEKPVCVVGLGDRPYLMPPCPSIVRDSAIVGFYNPVPGEVLVTICEVPRQPVDTVALATFSDPRFSAFSWQSGTLPDGEYWVEYRFNGTLCDRKKITVTR